MAAVVAVPILLLGGTEAVLRLAGYGHSTRFFVKRTVQGQAKWTDNRAFGLRFFPSGLERFPHPQAFPVQKPAGSLRIFVFGESAAMGDPDPRFGLPRMLEALLRERFPQRPIQVVNASMVAINSHAVLPIARECAGREGDLWLIYMGNNEMVGPFGALSAFGSQAPPLFLIRASLAFKRTRVGQLFEALLQRVHRNRNVPVEWEGMTMWANQKVRSSDPRTVRVHRYFRQNLQAILKAGEEAHVRVILCTVATNLKDCAPFGSLHRSTLAPSDLAKWDTVYHQGVDLQGKGQWHEALASYQQAIALDAEFADTYFRAAQCALALGDLAEAQRQFSQARDHDALQFRTDGQINDAIRQAAEGQAGVRLFDAERFLTAEAPQGVPGRECFYEHVHLNPHGNYLLARALADPVASALALSSGTPPNRIQPSATNKTAWAPEEDCLRAIGFTERNRHDLLMTILGREEKAPFTAQLNHSEQLEALRQQIEECRAAVKPFQMKRAAQRVAQAVAQRPADPDLHWNLAELLDVLDDVPAAEAQWRTVIGLLPQAPLPYFNLARLLDTHERTDEALQLYQQCLAVAPDYFDARYGLALLLIKQGRYGDAATHLQRVIQQQPDSAPAHAALGKAFQELGRKGEAEQQFQEADRIRSQSNPPPATQ